MTDDVKVKKPRGNPNWKKKDVAVPVGPDTTFVGNLATVSYVSKTAYETDVIWVMMMQSALQVWEARNDSDVSKAAKVADAALKEYNTRFGEK